MVQIPQEKFPHSPLSTHGLYALLQSMDKAELIKTVTVLFKVTQELDKTLQETADDRRDLHYKNEQNANEKINQKINTDRAKDFGATGFFAVTTVAIFATPWSWPAVVLSGVGGWVGGVFIAEATETPIDKDLKGDKCGKNQLMPIQVEISKTVETKGLPVVSNVLSKA